MDVSHVDKPIAVRDSSRGLGPPSRPGPASQALSESTSGVMDKREFLTTSAKGGAIVAAAVAVRYVIGFATQVTLARMLAPEVFGSVAFAGTVATFLNGLTNWHGDKYVIHQKACPRRAVDVAFTLELAASVFFIMLVFLLAPVAMHLLGKGELTLYVQILAFSFFHNPFSRPRCLLERNLSFFRSKLPFVVSQTVAAALAIALACYGFGIWSLLAWRLSIPAGEVAILWICASHRPRLAWQPDLAKDMLRFTWPLTLSGFLVFFYYNVDYFIVGQFLADGERQLGYYWLGFRTASYFLLSRRVLADVLFPIFSRLDDERFKSQAFQRLSQATAGVLLLPSLLIIFFGRDLVLLVYGSKWEPAVFPFQVTFITVLTRVISANTGYYLWSRGRTRPQVVMAAIFSLLLPPAAYWATLHYGIGGTALAVLLVQVVVVFVTYECYIRPATGRGTLYFFFWPWTLASLALALGSHGEAWTLAFPVRLGMFMALLGVAYFAVVRTVLRDVKFAIHSARSIPASAEQTQVTEPND